MNAVKILEEIGQRTSKKQYESTEDMLHSLEISDTLIKTIQENSIELVCGVKPEDDGDEK